MRTVLAFVSLLLSLPCAAERLNCPCRVVEITDGDTLFVSDQSRTSRKIWLAGIDAPETGQPFGEKSRLNLVKLALDKDTDIENFERDQYGRIVAKLQIGGRDINLQQIRDGYAWHYKLKKREQSRLDYTRYSAAETEARQKRIGLWSSSAIPPWEYRQKRR